MGAMQIVGVAPVLFAAGMAFTLLSLFLWGRRIAIPAAAGIFSGGVLALAVFYLDTLFRSLLRDFGPSGTLESAVYVIAGIFGASLCGALVHAVVAGMRPLPLRVTATLVAVCSYFVVMLGLTFAANMWVAGDTLHSEFGGVAAFCCELLLSFAGAWWVSRKPEQFRPRRIVMPAPFAFLNRFGSR